MYRSVAPSLAAMLPLLGVACVGVPQPITIHDSQALLVELAYDPRAGHGHSHPATVTAAQLTAMLRGVRLHGRDVMGTFGLLADERNSPAFAERDIAMLVPHLLAGLAKASPMDIVTFHLTQRDINGASLITSGGLFQRNRRLYLLLANARTSPASLQYETTYEPDSRANPLVPITRFKFMTSFVPADWRVPTSEAKKLDGWAGYLDESKVVVIDLDRIEQHDAATSRSPTPSWKMPQR